MEEAGSQCMTEYLYENRIPVKGHDTKPVVAPNFLKPYDFCMVKRKTNARPPAMIDLIAQWVDAGLDKAGKSNTALAGLLHLEPPRVSEMRNAKRRVLATELRTIAEYIEEPIPAELLPLGYQPQEVPVLSWVSAGAVSNFDNAEAIGVVRTSGLNPLGQWIALRVDGDSMDRISPPGSTIFVDLAERKLIPNACYVAADGDNGTTYKRYRPSPDRLEPVSTNSAHEPIFYEHPPRIIGRVKRTVLDL